MSDAPEYEDDRVLAGEYALGLLSGDEAAAFEARLAEEPELRALYAQWAEDFAAMAEDVYPVTPPAHLQRRIEARLFGTPERTPVARVLRWALGAAVAVVAMAMFTLWLARGPQPPGNPVYHADIVAEDGSLVLAAGYDAARAELYVERRAGQAREGRALELWLIQGDNPPVSLGVLPSVARARLAVEADLQGALEGGVLAVSDEPEGGSPTGLPTGEVLAVGEITTL